MLRHAADSADRSADVTLELADPFNVALGGKPNANADPNRERRRPPSNQTSAGSPIPAPSQLPLRKRRSAKITMTTFKVLSFKALSRRHRRIRSLGGADRHADGYVGAPYTRHRPLSSPAI